MKVLGPERKERIFGGPRSTGTLLELFFWEATSRQWDEPQESLYWTDSENGISADLQPQVPAMWEVTARPEKAATESGWVQIIWAHMPGSEEALQTMLQELCRIMVAQLESCFWLVLSESYRIQFGDSNAGHMVGHSAIRDVDVLSISLARWGALGWLSWWVPMRGGAASRKGWAESLVIIG